MAAVPPHNAHSSLLRNKLPARKEAKLPLGEARRMSTRSDRAGQKAARHDLVSQERETVSPEEAPGGVLSDSSGEPQGKQSVADTCHGDGSTARTLVQGCRVLKESEQSIHGRKRSSAGGIHLAEQATCTGCP